MRKIISALTCFLTILGICIPVFAATTYYSIDGRASVSDYDEETDTYFDYTAKVTGEMCIDSLLVDWESGVEGDYNHNIVFWYNIPSFNISVGEWSFSGQGGINTHYYTYYDEDIDDYYRTVGVFDPFEISGTGSMQIVDIGGGNYFYCDGRQYNEEGYPYDFFNIPYI